MKIWSEIDIGPVRSNQEDALHVGERLFVVSDGMGGHDAGEEASQAVVDAFAALDEEATIDRDVMIRAVADANDACLAASVNDRKGRGATCVAAYVSKDNVCTYIHVGDSRLYHLSEDTIRQVTNDHGYRNFLSNFVGYKQMQIEAGQFDVVEGDTLMLCSDGVSDVLSSERIAHVMRESKQPAAGLVALAIKEGTRDNCTAIVINI
jgi:protein phosphatase